MIYLDNAATTRVDDRVVEKMIEILSGDQSYGNPNSSHALGCKAQNLVREARENVAEMINADPEEIFFTSGGTESNNWAIYSGVVTSKKRYVVTSEIEHHSIHVCIEKFSKSIGVKPRFVPVDEDGVIDAELFCNRMCGGVGIVSVMLANNEIGTIQPIKEMVEVSQWYGVPFHVDAVQAPGKITIDVKDLGVDYLSLSGHKFHGPKGVGVFYAKKGSPIYPMISGGHQESGYRAGTYNVPGIVGIGVAAKFVNSQEEMKKIKRNGELLWDALKKYITDIKRNGSPNISVPGVVNVCFKGIEAKTAVLALSKRGICCSSGSACNEGQTSPSHVLKAIGLSTRDAHSSLRFSLSRQTTKEMIEKASEEIAKVVSECREVS